MGNPHNLLGQWLTAKQDAEFDVLAMNGATKVRIEKGKTYVVQAVISSEYSATLVLIDFDGNQALPVPLEDGLFALAK